MWKQVSKLWILQVAPNHYQLWDDVDHHPNNDDDRHQDHHDDEEIFSKWDSIQRYGGLSKCFELVQVGRLKNNNMLLWTCTSRKTKRTQGCLNRFIFLHCLWIFASILHHKSVEISLKIVKQILYVFCGYQTNKVSWCEFSFNFLYEFLHVTGQNILLNSFLFV